MKIVVIFLAALVALASSKNVARLPSPIVPFSFHIASLPRQPYVSPEQDAQLDAYRRFKRQGEESGDDATSPVPVAVQRFQHFLNDCKGQCGSRLGFAPNEIEKSLLFEENPTPKEKCLMACVLERTKIMTETNQVSVDTISRLAALISDNNELIIAIARASADKCNRNLNPADKCEAAFQINRCISHGLKNHKIRITY